MPRYMSSGPTQSPIENTVSIELRPALGIGGDHAEHQVGMPADIFAAGLDREVDAFFQRAEIERARPGIVHQHDRAARRARPLAIAGTSCTSNDSEPGDSTEHRAGIRLHQRGDAAADQRIEIGRGDARAVEHGVAEIARRPIDIVGDQHMVAGMQDRQQRQRDAPQAPTAAARRRRIAALRSRRSAPASASEVGVPRRP